MPRKFDNRRRKLWINIKVQSKFKDKIFSKDEQQQVVKSLIQSIRNGDYEYSKDLHVTLEWRNYESGQMRRGEFSSEMEQSSYSSPGFDYVVTQYLQRKLTQ